MLITRVIDMSENESFDKFLNNKKILFAGSAAIGGILSGLIITSLPGVINDNFFSWVLSGALDTALIGAMVVYAQNYYQTKSFNITSGLKQAFKKGLVAGFVGGIAAYIGMYLFGAGNFGRSIGWAISGGVAGFVVSGQVPNLKQPTAIAAGAIGGFVGCMIMYMDFGYTLGVAITGAAIGLMVAMAEVIFRKNWLDVEIFSEVLGSGLNLSKPINQYTLTIGSDPITIGSRNGMDINLKSNTRSSNAHAASIYVENEKVIFHDLITSAKTELMADIPFRFYECLIKLGG